MARASLESRRRMLISERANSAIADEQLRRAGPTTRWPRAPSTAGAAGGTGLHPDAAIRPVPSHAARREVSLKQAQQQQAAAASTIGDEAEAQAAVQAREAALARARHSLEQTVVRAPTTAT